MITKKDEVKILIIEDDEDDAFLLSRQLRKMTRFNAQTFTETDLDAGFSAAAVGDFDAVFVDYYWGDSTVDSVLDEQRSRLASVPVVVVTSSDDFETNEAVIESGAWDFIAKSDLNAKLLERTILGTLQRKRHEQEMYRLVRHDSLTGLANRMMFDEQLKQATSRADRRKTRCAVLTMDLDEFKQVNDTLGHDVGDMLLRLVADRLQKGLRTEDTLARLGGDEFAILIEDVDSTVDLETIASKLLSALREPAPIKGLSGKITGSIGIAVYPDNARTPLELMRHSDIALYSSKDAGKNRVSLFNDELERSVYGDLELEHQIRESMTAKDFVPFFQPRYGCDDNRVHGVEVLMRWRHPSRGVLLPDEFMPVAEKVGLMFDLDRTLIRTALELLAPRDSLPGAESGYKMAFNITAAQLLDGRFPEEMRELMEQYRVDPGYIEFEIVEDVLADRRARETLTALRDIGFGLAIDDFGTGFSSFSHLRDLPLTTLKLDRSFVRDLDTVPANHGICEAIACLGKRLGLLVIGEGVETRGQLDLLRELEVDSVQGFLMSRPLEPDEWISLHQTLKQQAH